MSDTGQPTSYIELLAPIWPGGNFGSHEDIFGKGGFITLQDSVGSDSDTQFINVRVRRSRRKEGMLVYINDNGRYYRCTDIGTNNNDGVWKREYFTGRYFHGPTAPTADDIVMGERWFDTVVGTEYTYVPIAEGSTYLAWIDLDHMGEGDRYINSDGDVFTGTLTGDILDVNHITADTGFIGTLTGNIADFGHVTADTGFIGTLTGEKASFRNTQDGRASLEVAIGSTGYTDNFWDFVAGTIVNEEGLTSNVFGVSTTSHSQTPSAGVFNGNLIVGQPGYNEKSRLEVWGSINTTGNNNYSVLSTFRSPTLFRGFTAQNSDYWEGGTNNLTIGNDYDEDLKVSLRAFNDVVVGRAHRNSDTPITFPREFITKEYAENNFGSGDIEITNGTNISDPFSPYNWELTKIVLGRTDVNGTLLKSIYRIEPQKPSSGNLSGNNITLNFSYLCGNSTYDLLDIVLDVNKNNTYESYGGIYSSAHSIHTNNIDKRFVNNNGAIKITYANPSITVPSAWFNNTIYLSCLFKI